MERGVLRIKQQQEKSVVQKKDAYNDVTSKYPHKIDNQKKKLMILYKCGIENYMVFKEK